MLWSLRWGFLKVIPAPKRNALYHWAKHRGEEAMAEKMKAVARNRRNFRWISYKTYEMSDGGEEDPLKTVADSMSAMAEAMTATSWKQLLSLQVNSLREVAELYKTNMIERHRLIEPARLINRFTRPEDTSPADRAADGDVDAMDVDEL